MFRHLLTTFSLFYLCGCATIIKGDNQPLTVNSNVEGADVYLDGMKIGTTPFSGLVPRKKGPTILLVKYEGYKDRKITIDTTVEPVFFVNILSGGVLGSTTDFASESMFKYAPSTYHVDLIKKN